ncbi:hypothetical protein SB751_33955, partial [Cupriavidus sp. SIMBA_020]|uniref:hypothetical protein n=1 Tax=Cupriavidus sp. SIMBA_020 TaxID=3085766 RepID=UPI00397D82D4
GCRTGGRHLHERLEAIDQFGQIVVIDVIERIETAALTGIAAQFRVLAMTGFTRLNVNGRSLALRRFDALERRTRTQQVAVDQ